MLSKGLRYMAFASFCFSVMSVLVKTAGQMGVPTQEIVLARSLVTLLLSILMLARSGISPWGVNRKILIARGLTGFAALSCFYYAVTHLPLAEATVIQYTNPLLTAILAAVILGERMRGREAVAALLSLVGIVLIARPTFIFGGGSAIDPTAIGIALLGASLSAFAYVWVRKLAATDDPLVVVFYFPLISVPLSVPAVIPVWQAPSLEQLGVLVAVGVATQLGQLYMTRGLHLETAGRASTVSYLQILFAFAFGMMFFGEVPDLYSLGGTVLVIGAIVYGTRGRTGQSPDARAPSGPPVPLATGATVPLPSVEPVRRPAAR
jgi:drug/metabolite transporter (DMT)-like permease